MKILAVCGGNGVIVHPLKQHLIANLEPRAIFHNPNKEQWRENFKGIPMYKKQEDVYIAHGKVDCIIGAPDCGHSSMLALSRGKKMTDPLDNDSLMMFINTCKYYKPRVFLMENLPAMLKSVTREWFREQFPDYSFDFIEEPVTYFGNSQATRKRLVIVAAKIGHSKSADLLRRAAQIPTKNPQTVEQLLEDLPDNGNVREAMDKKK